LSRSSRTRSAPPAVFTCASKMAPRLSANGDCEAPERCGKPTWVAIAALSAPAASISARRAHPGLAVSAATVRAVRLSGGVAPRRLSSLASVVLMRSSLPGLGGSGLPTFRAGAVDGGQAGSEQLLDVIQLPPGAVCGLRPVILVPAGVDVQFRTGCRGDSLCGD